MANVFLREWAAGDVVSAADLQDLTAAVAALENMGRRSVCGRSAGGVVRAEGAELEEWPWQVVVEPTGGGQLEVFVLPGRVMVGGDSVFCDYAGAVRGGFDWVTLGGKMVSAGIIQRYESDRHVVWLRLRGEVEARVLTAAELGEELQGDYVNEAWSVFQRVSVQAAELDVFVRPLADVPDADGCLRLWPLAVVHRGHEVMVTQLVWGDLSACECRGVVAADGEVVWPAARGEVSHWKEEDHGNGMATLCAVDFSTAAESIRGELRGCMDEDGAVEFYLGVNEEPPYTGEGGPEAPGGTLEDGDDDGEDGDDDDYDGDDDGDDEKVPPNSVAVQIGYEAGEGFESCELVRKGGGYYWKLQLNGGFVRAALHGIEVPAVMTFTAAGQQAGAYAAVEMGLGETAVQDGGGRMVTGSAELLFHGSNDVDASLKETGHPFVYNVSLDVQVPDKVWYLSPRALSSAGKWVRMSQSAGQSNSGVRANRWYMFSVDSEKLREAAVNQLRKELAARAVNDTVTDSAADSTVTATLSGSALSIHAAAVLQ